jgi:hypothetical protein
MNTRSLMLLVVAIASVLPAAAQGILGKSAPELHVDSWVSLPKGEKAGPTLESLKGKITYLYFFQSW